MWFLLTALASRAAWSDSHFEFSGGFFLPLYATQINSIHEDLMWGFGVDSFVIGTESQLNMTRRRGKIYSLHNGCKKHHEMYPQDGQVTCYSPELEQIFLNQSTSPNMVLLEQFHEKTNYQEQKKAIQKFKTMYPDITPVISQATMPESSYREFLKKTGAEHLLICNYPFFGYENDILEDV